MFAVLWVFPSTYYKGTLSILRLNHLVSQGIIYSNCTFVSVATLLPDSRPGFYLQGVKGRLTPTALHSLLWIFHLIFSFSVSVSELIWARSFESFSTSSSLIRSSSSSEAFASSSLRDLHDQQQEKRFRGFNNLNQLPSETHRSDAGSCRCYQPVWSSPKNWSPICCPYALKFGSWAQKNLGGFKVLQHSFKIA